MFDRIHSAPLAVLQAWMLGAGLIGFGLGAFFAGKLGWMAIGPFLGGVIIHGWAMMKLN